MRSIIVATANPVDNDQSRSQRSPYSVSAVTANCVHTRPWAASEPIELLDQLTTGEDDRIEMLDRSLEVMVDGQARWRIFGARRTVVGTRRHAPRRNTLPAEARQHIGLGQCRQIAQRAQAQPAEQMDLLGLDVADVVQPAQRQRRQEGRRLTGRHHVRLALTRGVARRHTGGEPTVGDAHTDTDRRSG